MIYGKCLDCGSEFVVVNRIRNYCKECHGLKIMRGKGNDVGIKKCPRCKLYLSILKFNNDKTKRCRSYCKDCEKIIAKKRHDYMIEYSKKYKKTEKAKAARRVYRNRLRANLSPSYLKKLISRYMPIKESEIPEEALEIKRAVVEIRRAIK